MKRSVFSAVIVLLALLYVFWTGNTPGPPLSPAEQNLVVTDVRVFDMDGRLAYAGDVDLAPALERIARAEADPHPNDGSIFRNRERLLPQKPQGYYREYVIRTPGIGHAGPQRLVIGQEGEVYYTSDHYQSFKRIK